MLGDPLTVLVAIQKRSLYVETYGCQMNKADSELIVGLLLGEGYLVTEKIDQADVILVNTCAIRENAEQRVLGRMSELNKFKVLNPSLILGLCGCMSQHLGDQIIEKAPYYKHIKKVKPWITSWGVVRYGYASSVDEMVERLKYDIIYIENMSIFNDLKVLIYTFKIVFQGRGK